MPNVRPPDHTPQARAVEIVADALRVLRTRDKIDVSSDLIEERARNIVAALDFESISSDAAAAVAGLLADPFDPDARAAARTWLRVWEAGARPQAATCPCGEGGNPLHALLAHGSRADDAKGAR